MELALSLERELRQVIAELDLVSHVNAASMDSSGSRDTSDDIGGKRPGGGIDKRDDNADDWLLKSAAHYRDRAEKARSERALQIILDQATLSLAAWKRQPLPSGEPEYGTPLWKAWVAASPMPTGDVARKYGVSRQYVDRIRRQYREAA